MMGLSSLGGGGGGGGNPSTSNLSASAVPFTVDRLNPKPNSNPLLHYSDSPYVVSRPSQYAHFSAPRTEPTIDSNEIISAAAVSDGYQFSASASVSPSSAQWSAHNSAYGGDAKPPYYNPYVPPLVGEESLFPEDEGSLYNAVLNSGLGVKSQKDYARSSFDLEYGLRWEDSLSLDDEKRAKRSEFDVNSSSEKQYVGASHGYENQTYRGGHGSENRNKFEEDSGYKNLNHVSEREVYTGSSSNRYMEDKSCLDRQLGFFHCNPSRNLLIASGSPYPESYPSVISSGMQKDFPNYQNSQSPYEKCIRPVDAPFPGKVSVTRSSPTVVIRPPPATNWNLGQGAASHKPAGVNVVHSDYNNPSKTNISGSKSNSKSIDDSFETSLFKSSKQWNTRVSSISVRELSSPLPPKDNVDCKIKTTLGSQVPNVNVSSGFTLTGGNIQVVNSTGETLEFIDNHSTAVDSPCWRGAPSSKFSMFDIEAGNSNHVEINIDEHYGLHHGEHQSFLSTIDSNRVFSEKVQCNMGNENECGKNGETLGLEKTLDAICSTAEQICLDGTLDTLLVPPPIRSKGVEFSGGPNMMMKELNLQNNLSSVFEKNVSDINHLFGEDSSGMTVNVVSEGAAVAVHAAENVLSSPASQEDEQTLVPVPGLDVPAILKTILSLSELLRIQISSDLCSLGEENTEILKHVISILSTCLSSKKYVQAQAANNPEPKHLVGETSGILEAEKSSSTVIFSGGSRTKCEPSSCCTKPDYLHFQDGDRNFIFCGKKDEISPIILPLSDDLHITEDDDMTKAMKKVLEQNFRIDEDMHSQALLFKSLWLESEAKLCSISYKARFERMKNQMEEIKLKSLKDEDTAEMTSEHSMSPDPFTVSELTAKARVGTFAKLTSPNNFTCGMSGNADDIESSVLARLNILKSREENPKLVSTEEQQQSEVVAGNHADSIVARFNILKSRDKNSKQISMDKETLLPWVVNDVLAENEAVDVALQPDFQYASGSLAGGKFNSYFERAGCGSPTECGVSASNDPAIHLLKENNSGLGDSSSTEWEHVMKEDFSWKY